MMTIKRAANQCDALLFHIYCHGGPLPLFLSLTEVIRLVCKNKPNVAFIDNATGGGYALTAASDYTVCNPFGYVGGISFSIPYKPAKKPCTVVQAGSHQLAGQELTQEVEESLQHIANRQHQQFCKTMANLRGLDAGELKLTDGKSFLADDALELKLIDEIGYFPDAIAALKIRLAGAGFDVSSGINLLSEGPRSITL